ncbi:HdeD family acid-resistance protein [Paracoccus methylarcula]|uniref:HdeD family acid-resistance protein n=1 Tax=Paracoccus methylarcula TaxID=72022 RepID=A0A3R7NCS1_9RHOB|nr:DUF308 domain-containing protein [Paracoccus methylarcula]RNF35088.1 hypothetical protein A7A09_008135 [Paracoccus methylarcula]
MRIFWIVLGGLSIVAGVLALANPLAATLTAERLAGWSFLFIGVLEIFAVFQQKSWRGRIWAILAGLAFAILGVMLLARPLAGILSLTLIVAILFLVAGAVKLAMAFSLERGNGFWLILLSGALSIVLALMIFANFPASAATILGVLLAIELISNGVSMIALSSSAPVNKT